MPGTSHGSKGKHPHKSKKSKAIRRQQSGAVRPAAAMETARAVPMAVTHSPAAPAHRIAKIPEYPYVAGELKRIGILAGILLGILIVLSIILS